MSKLRKPRMTWRLWAVFLASIVLLGTPFLLPAPAFPSAVTRANFDKVQQGMTDDEVEAVLGPQGNYSQNRPRVVGQSGLMCRRYWVSDEGTVIVEMGAVETGMAYSWQVADKKFFPAPMVSYGVLWLRRLGLV
jgi:hypothetical protein